MRLNGLLLRGGKASVRMVTRARRPVEGRRRVHGWGDCGRPGGGHCYGGQDSQAALLKSGTGACPEGTAETGTDDGSSVGSKKPM